MQAVILAAGWGRRLGEREGRKPKGLHKVGGKPLIVHQLDALAQAGIHSVCIVVGYEGDQIIRVVGPRADYVENEHFARTNSLYSFLRARPRVNGEVLVLNSDVLFPPFLPGLMKRVRGNAVAYDSGSGESPEHMKVEFRNGRLFEMSKRLPPARTHGENLGMVRLDRNGAEYTFKAGNELVRNGHGRDWLASAINLTAGRYPFTGVDIAGMPWVEIDYLEDLVRARTEVWPAIRNGTRPFTPSAEDLNSNGSPPRNRSDPAAIKTDCCPTTTENGVIITLCSYSTVGERRLEEPRPEDGGLGAGRVEGCRCGWGPPE